MRCSALLHAMQACIAVSQAAGSVHLGARQFTYDYAFGPEAQQQDVYAGCVSSLVDSVLEGYNATVLAYGPTGSGMLQCCCSWWTCCCMEAAFCHIL